MGPISPAVLGGFEHVSNITEEYTKWTEVPLIQTKREAEDTIQVYVKSLAAPLGYRIVRLRADRGTEYHILKALSGSIAAKQRPWLNLLPPTRLARLA